MNVRIRGRGIRTSGYRVRLYREGRLPSFPRGTYVGGPFQRRPWPEIGHEKQAYQPIRPRCRGSWLRGCANPIQVHKQPTGCCRWGVSMRNMGPGRHTRPRLFDPGCTALVKKAPAIADSSRPSGIGAAGAWQDNRRSSGRACGMSFPPTRLMTFPRSSLAFGVGQGGGIPRGWDVLIGNGAGDRGLLLAGAPGCSSSNRGIHAG